MARQYENLSPFLLTLVEQWKFVQIDNPKESVIVKWLLIFFRNMLVLGESEVGIRNLLSNVESIPHNLVELYLSFTDEIIKKVSSPEYLLFSNDSTSSYDHILLQYSPKLSKMSRFPVNSFDVAAIIFRLKKTMSGSLL